MPTSESATSPVRRQNSFRRRRPSPQWHSDATVSGDLIWSAGQIPRLPDGGMPDSFDA